MALPKLLYFATRGRAEVTRLVLAETGVPYEEENFALPDFPALKKSGRLPFGAVPLWEEDGLKLAQSVAIAAHVARAHGLYGKNPREVALIEQACGAVEDVRNEFRRISSAPAEKRPEIRAELTATALPRWFGQLERLLAANGGGDGFVVGDSLSVADLALWYCLEIAKDNGFGATLADCPKLSAFFDRIAARPKIAAYLKSPKRWPLTKLPG
jgi:glutathione S-transferase